MHGNSKSHFKKESSEWTVVIISTVIAITIVLGYLYHIKRNPNSNPPSAQVENTQSSLSSSDKSNDKVPDPLPANNQDMPASSLGIHKCLVAGKTIYTETSCPDASQPQELSLVDNRMDSAYLRQHINDLPKVVMLEQPKGESYMSDREIQIRIKELESSIQSITASGEKIAASQNELPYMHRKPKQLSQSDEIRRRNLRVDLDRLDAEARRNAVFKLQAEIYSKY